jgi:hypothetical protein
MAAHICSDQYSTWVLFNRFSFLKSVTDKELNKSSTKLYKHQSQVIVFVLLNSSLLNIYSKLKSKNKVGMPHRKAHVESSDWHKYSGCLSE